MKKPSKETTTASQTSASRTIAMGIVDGTSGIYDIEAEQKSGVAYNLNGQRVSANAKGIVIINGKKYINK